MGVVLHFQSTGSIPGDGRPVPMVGNSLTIGRANDNDLVLPDPDRIISSHHCAIEDQNGNLVVIDFSTNGTFLNYGKVPLGRVPTPLNDGDILSIGNYELAVELRTQAAQSGPELLGPAESGPVAPQGARPDGGLEGLLDAPGPGGGDVISDLLGEDAAPVGPKGVRRPDLGEDGLLPPLGEEEAGDPLAAGPDPNAGLGASQAMNSPSVQDRMPLPRVSGDAIPDDWDLDLPSAGHSDLAPPSSIEPVPDDPFGTPPVPAEPPAAVGQASAFIPDDPDFGPGTDPLAVQSPAAAPEVTSAPAAPAPATASGPAASTPAGSAGRLSTGATPAGGETEMLRVVLRAAGLPDAEVPPEEAEEMAARLGNVLRILVHGMREILMTRTSIKSEFRIDQTRIAASGNNPLKFSVTPEQAVEVMVGAPKRGYLSAEAAAEQALQDIKAHEVATLTGMEAALKGVLRRLSPEALEEQITAPGGIGGLLKGKKARYWEAYERIYGDVADAAENDFHELFSREFARAYQEQLDKLKDGS